jgi:hypothetical protein
MERAQWAVDAFDQERAPDLLVERTVDGGPLDRSVSRAAVRPSETRVACGRLPYMERGSARRRPRRGPSPLPSGASGSAAVES